MAKHVAIGEPVNDAERWAFKLLAGRLPDEYLVITNLEILAQSGQPMEVDALVLGEYALYVLDVKGYFGELRATMNDWRLDGSRRDNSLRKANEVARVLAGRLRDRLPRGGHIPWCQGVVLLTGQQGEHISLYKDPESLCVYTPSEIIEALTSRQFVTSAYQHPVTEEQKRHALTVIGTVGVMASRQNHVRDFIKKQRLSAPGALEIWEAEFCVGDWRDDWLLKIVDAHAAGNPDVYAQLTGELKDEFFRLQQLSGVSGVPTCAPLISDGEQFVLPLKRPRGVPMSVFDFKALDEQARLELVRRAVISLQQIHARGSTVGNISADDVFVSMDGDLEFLDVRGNVTADEDVAQFRIVFRSLLSESTDKGILGWFGDNVDDSLESLRSLLASALSGKQSVVAESVVLESGAVLADRYRLAKVLSDRDYGQLWQAHHVAGRFDCGLAIYFRAGEYWDQVVEQYASLMQVYHPALERVFDIGQLPGNDMYYLCREWVNGDSLDKVVIGTDAAQQRMWLRELLSALQVLHRQGLIHKNINPLNIICTLQRAVLVNFSGLPDKVRIGGDVRFTDPLVSSTGWSIESDIYSLLLSFYLPVSDGAKVTNEILEAVYEHAGRSLGEDVAGRIFEFLVGRPAVDEESDYLALFGLAETDAGLTELPDAFRAQWQITSGYMEFLVVDMLNDGRARSRKQWVLNALRSRHIPGNRTNRGSVSSTISRLKTAGIAEDYGTKVRLTKKFVESWEVYSSENQP